MNTEFTYTPHNPYDMFNKKAQKRQIKKEYDNNIHEAKTIYNIKRGTIDIRDETEFHIISDTYRDFNGVSKYLQTIFCRLKPISLLDSYKTICSGVEKNCMIINIHCDIPLLVVSSKNFIIKSPNGSQICLLIILCDEAPAKCALFLDVNFIRLFGQPVRKNPYPVNLYFDDRFILGLMSVYGEIDLIMSKVERIMLILCLDYDIKVVNQPDLLICRMNTLVVYLAHNPGIVKFICNSTFADILKYFETCAENPHDTTDGGLLLRIYSQLLYAMKYSDNEISYAVIALFNNYQEFIVVYKKILRAEINPRKVYHAVRSLLFVFDKSYRDHPIFPFCMKIIKKNLGAMGICKQFL